MDTIIIDSGIKRVAITDKDGNLTGEISFNPTDLIFVEKFQALYTDVRDMQKKFEARAKEVGDALELDENGVPKDAHAVYELLRQMNDDLRAKIDYIFGQGASQVIFGDHVSSDFSVYIQFLRGVAPMVQAVRAQKVEQYTGKRKAAL